MAVMYTTVRYPRHFALRPYEGRRQPSSPVGQDSLHMPFDHPGHSGHLLVQSTGLLAHRSQPRPTVAEQFFGDPDVPPFLDNLRRLPNLVDHTLKTP